MNCCEKPMIFTEDGEVVCGNCGVVHGMDDPENILPKTYEEGGLVHNTPIKTNSMGATVIGNENKDHNGTKISGEMASSMKRLKTWDTRVKLREKGRRQKDYLLDLESKMYKLNMGSHMAMEARSILNKHIKNGITRGRTVNDVQAAVIYGISKKYDTGISQKTISDSLHANRKLVNKYYKLMSDDFERDPSSENLKDTYKYRGNKLLHANRIVDNLNITIGSKVKIKKYIEKVMGLPEMDFYIGGKDLNPISAASIYAVSVLDPDIKGQITQREVAGAAGVTDVTIRNRYGEIIDVINGSGKMYKIFPNVE